MDSTLRTTKGLEEKINSLQSNLLKRYSNLVGLAAVSPATKSIHASQKLCPSNGNHAQVKKPDRTAAAVTQYQIQTETAALVSEHAVIIPLDVNGELLNVDVDVDVYFSVSG